MSEARKGAPKIALNMSMVKTIMWDKGPDYTFERVKAAGLSYFELSQVDMTDAFIDQVLEASAKHGVTVMSTSLNYKPLFGPNAKGFDIERDLDRIIEANKRLGVTYVRDSLIPRICIHSEEGYYKAAEDLNHYGKLLKEQGLKLYYHNHHFEFEKFNGKTGFELLVENTDPELVGFEIDVHWIQRAGHDPVKWIERKRGHGASEGLPHLFPGRRAVPGDLPPGAVHPVRGDRRGQSGHEGHHRGLREGRSHLPAHRAGSDLRLRSL